MLFKWNIQGFNIVHDTRQTIFEEISKYSERKARYAAVMTWFSTGQGLEPAHVIDSFDWNDLGTEVVVNIEGFHGSISIALVQNFSSLHCIVQDRSAVVKLGREKLPSELIDRVGFMEHDFFIEQPVKHANVYFLRWILHDWSDTYAIQGLRALIPALKPGAKIVICEKILPEPGSVSTYQDRAFR